MRGDGWGTYLRAEISDFCFFVCGREIHPSDPTRLEDCENKGVIEVQNATDVELYLVLVPVSFSSDNMSKVTYTGNIGVGFAGVTLAAGVGSAHESANKSHMLPAGLSPDEISVAAGGTFQFEPPAEAKQGKLLIATITEDSQTGFSVKVVVYHTRFVVSVGKRRVILPICLQSKSSITARLGPDDTPATMVMIMGGLGSKGMGSTVVTTPEDAFHLTARSSMASAEAPATLTSAVVPPAPTQRQNGAMPGCGVS